MTGNKATEPGINLSSVLTTAILPIELYRRAWACVKRAGAWGCTGCRDVPGYVWAVTFTAPLMPDPNELPFPAWPWNRQW